MESLKSLWIWTGRVQLECLTFRFKTNIRAKYESLLHIINKLNPHGERQVASGVGRNCCFWRAACFCSEVSSWNGRLVQYFLIKAQHYPKILSRGKQDFLASSGLFSSSLRDRNAWDRNAWAHNVLLKYFFTALSLPCLFVPPPQITSAPLPVSLQTMDVLWVLHKHWIQDNTLMKISTHYSIQSLKDAKVNIS